MCIDRTDRESAVVFDDAEKTENVFLRILSK